MNVCSSLQQNFLVNANVAPYILALKDEVVRRRRKNDIARFDINAQENVR
jgi:hypothetical protein